MRILNATCFQNTGGVNQVFCDYSKVLQDRGHEVALANVDLSCEMTRKAFLRLEKDFSFDSLGVEMERIINFVTKK